MRQTLLATALLSFALSACAAEPPADAAATPAATPAADPAPAPASGDALQQAIAGDWRTPDNVARDAYRRPAETLAFFGLQPTQTVVEITPGGGWYTEILAPYLRDGGTYIAAVVDPQAVEEGRGRDYQQRGKDNFEKKIAGSPAHYDKTVVVAYDPAAPRFGEPGSADLVLTFRNVHNWLGDGKAEAMFKGFFEVLKPGGTLGVVEHRASPGTVDPDSGYVAQTQVIALAEMAGFTLQEASELNANPKDTKDHPNGVWTLPPGNRHDAEDAQKYRDIGESDRMTLRFVKP